MQNLGFFLHTQTSVQLPLLSNSTRLRLRIFMPTRHDWLYAEEELWRYRLHHCPVHSWLHGPPVPQGPCRVRPLWSRQLWIGPVQLVPVKESNHISSKTVCFRWRLTKHCVKNSNYILFVLGRANKDSNMFWKEYNVIYYNDKYLHIKIAPTWFGSSLAEPSILYETKARIVYKIQYML